MEEMKDLGDARDGLSRVGGKLAFLQMVLGTLGEGIQAFTMNEDEQAGLFWIFQDLTEDVSQIKKAMDEDRNEKQQKVAAI